MKARVRPSEIGLGYVVECKRSAWSPWEFNDVFMANATRTPDQAKALAMASARHLLTPIEIITKDS